MTMIQIRNVPADVHRTLKMRAASEGLTLSDYLLRDIERLAQRPTRAEMVARLRALPPVRAGDAPRRAVRAERDAG